jgi:hypothetical protein
MGAWGEGNFENDDALDWLAGLEQAHDVSTVASALSAVCALGRHVLRDSSVPRGSCLLHRAGRSGDPRCSPWPSFRRYSTASERVGRRTRRLVSRRSHPRRSHCDLKDPHSFRAERIVG